MTTPVAPDPTGIFQYVVPGGQVVLTAQFETFYGSDVEQAVSGTTITITAVTSGTVAVATTSAGITQNDPATFTYAWSVPTSTVPDDYTVLWAATGPNGAQTITQTVTCVPLPSPTPGPGVYATPAQYVAWSGDTSVPVWLLQTTLRRASEVIDAYAVGAVYETDADEMPTQPGVIDLFMRATCAQCQFELANDDPARVKSQYSSISVGGVSRTRAPGALQQTAPPLAPQAAIILRTSGLLGTAVLISW
jgi:hypothetical protein